MKSIQRYRFPSRTVSASASAAAAAALLLLSAGCPARKQTAATPPPQSPDYARAVQAFYVGLIKMETTTQGADASLAEVTKLAPGEPAGWANLGIFQMRANKYEEAVVSLNKARELAPREGRIEALLGLLESRRGKSAEAITHLRRAVELTPDDLRATYALAQEISRESGTQGADTGEYERLLTAILERQPDNLVVLLESARAAAMKEDRALLAARVAAVAKQVSPSWSPDTRAQLATLQKAAAGPNLRPAANATRFLGNLLKPIPEYRQDSAAVESPIEQIGQPFETFLVLNAPTGAPAPADTALSYAPAVAPPTAAGKWTLARAFRADGEAKPGVLLADARRVLLPGIGLTLPGGAKTAAPRGNEIALLDFNYDFKMDVAVASAGGLLLARQDAPGKFTDVTRQAKLPPVVLSAAYQGAWPADIEADGDLDVVAAPVSGPPVVIRNNGDGTFAAIRPFGASVTGARGFAWADLDDDGDPDAVLLDGTGKLHFFTNERSGLFTPRPAPGGLPGKTVSLAVADLNRDGVLDIAALSDTGTIIRISDKDGSAAWDTAEVAAATGMAAAARLLIADLDNNGAVDLIVAGTDTSAVLLAEADGKFVPLASAAPVGLSVFDAADLNGDGLLDLIGLAPGGKPTVLEGKSAKSYHYQIVRPRSDENQPPEGNKRINAYAFGGEIEARAGLLYQKQPIQGPVVHLGLGEQTQTDAIRLIWPNGTVNAAFDQKADTAIVARQNLKGSCPFLFAWDGKKMTFVTDCIWRSPLGLKINAQDTAGVAQTEDWIKIRGEQMVPRNGVYDLRITAELWETHLFDHLSLMAVDHPEDTEIWIDERFAFPQPPLQVIVTRAAQPVLRATDDNGGDATELIAARDGRHVDNFGRGAYQGVTRDHYLEIVLPPDAPRSKPLYLIANGWIHPTDTSINVALGQGKGNPIPTGLSLEIPDGRGGWRVARPGLGFPTGKVKTIVLDLSGLWKPGEEPRRLRLRTNLEIFWDQIRWAEGAAPAIKPTETRLAAKSAELRYRGFSVVTSKDKSSPEMPQDYDELAGTGQAWRDLIGYYTRFGDVRPLLGGIDDRYVIMNAGDEMRLTFAALPAPPAGMKRDFVLIGDGWVKDGDYNTAFGKTVMPLPTHADPRYETPPGHLENDPVYRRNRNDWQTYHTRYVAPDRFAGALRRAKRP